jgi:WD40 repeat protein
VLSFLGIKDLATVALSSRQLAEAARSNPLWRGLYIGVHSWSPLPGSFEVSRSDTGATRAVQHSPWFRQFLEKRRTEARIAAGRYQFRVGGSTGDKLMDTEGHNGIAGGERLIFTASAAMSGRAVVWDKGTDLPVAVLKGANVSPLQCVACVGDAAVAAGDLAGAVNVWHIDGERVVTHRVLRGHRLGVRAISVTNARVVSASFDGTCCVWSTHSGDLLHTLDKTDCADGIVSLTALEHVPFGSGITDSMLPTTFFSGSKDGTVAMWQIEGASDIATPTTTTTATTTPTPASASAQSSSSASSLTDDLKPRRTLVFRGHTKAVRCVSVSGNRLCSASDDGTVKVWSLDMRALVATVRMAGPVRAAALDGSMLFSATTKGGENRGRIAVWNILAAPESDSAELEQPVYTVKKHIHAVTALYFDGRKLLSACGEEDPHLIAWDFGPAVGEVVPE